MGLSSSSKDRIKELEEELSKTKYNKRTQRHIGLVKAKIAVIKEKQERKKAGKGKTEGYTVRKTGDGTAILIGFPSVGKSTLLNAITNAESPIAAYQFTTLTCIPGMMEHRHAKIQILDVPGIVSGAATGRGRGKEVLSCAVNSNLAILMVDVFSVEHLDTLKKEVYQANLRIDQNPPDVRIEKYPRGGIHISALRRLTHTDTETLTDILKEFRIMNAHVNIREDITVDQFIDVLEKNKRYIPGMVILNKIDMVSEEDLERIKHKYKPDVMISAEKKIGMEELKEKIFEKLDLMEVYCKEQNKKADLDEPMIIRRSSSLGDFCDKLHRDFRKRFRFARIWGKSSKFPGQQIRRFDHVLIDGDIVEIHLA